VQPACRININVTYKATTWARLYGPGHCRHPLPAQWTPPVGVCWYWSKVAFMRLRWFGGAFKGSAEWV